MPRTGSCAAALALLLSVALPAQPVAAQGRVDADIASLSAEVAKLEGARAVKKLQRAFGYYMDRGLWSEAADLFADSGTLEIGADGVYVGRARIQEYLKRSGGGRDGLFYGQLNEWVTLQPVVTVAADGRTAKARWRDLGMLGNFKKDAYWRDGIYENDYVFEDGVWKIAAMHLYINFVAPYESGWARLRSVSGDWRSDAAKAFPPDRSPSQRYKTFPDAQLPAFHYANPVTGRRYQGKQP